MRIPRLPIIREHVTDEAVAEAKRLIDRALSVTVLTGAGISTDSGIPDFRGTDGIWTKNPDLEATSGFSSFVSDVNIRRRQWNGTLGLMDEYEPSVGHKALKYLDVIGKLKLIATTNVDGLHQKAGVSDDKVIELHGNLRNTICISCDWSEPRELTAERAPSENYDPRCLECGDITQVSAVMFGQMLNMDDLERCFQAAETASVLLVVGTSLVVPPSNRMPMLAREAGVPTILLNNQSTEMDRHFDVRLRSSIAKWLPEIVGMNVDSA